MRVKNYATLLLIVALFILFPVRAAAEPSDNTKNIFTRLSDAGFALTRTSDVTGQGKPADFGFLADLGKKTEFHANFLLKYSVRNSILLGDTDLTPSASVEGKLSSSENKAEDAWRFRLGSQFNTSPMRLWSSVNVKYEGDRDFRTRKVSAEFQVSPTMPCLFMGAQPAYISKTEERPVLFRWRPIFGADIGHTISPGVSKESNSTILRLTPRTRADLFLNFLKKPLGMKEVSLYVDNSLYYLPLEEKNNTHEYFVTGINFMINDNVGLSFEYRNGEDSPNFVRANTVGGSFSITF